MNLSEAHWNLQGTNLHTAQWGRDIKHPVQVSGYLYMIEKEYVNENQE